MYFSKLLLGFFSLFVSTPTHAGDFSYNEPSTAWANLPAGSSIPVERVRLSFSPDEVLQMQDSLKHARHSYLNSGDRDQNDWISRASDSWSEITVPNLETDLNRHPQFNASLAVDGQSSNIHFMALFSQEPAAIPIVLLHGWPGNVAEFSDLFDIFRSRYSPADCPFHLIVPSLPGYTFSSGNPILDRADLVRVTRTIDRFLADIGLDNGYIAHGGDIGSYIARMLGSYSSNCKGGLFPDGTCSLRDC
ncbi:Alpha/Beta hydrolase protein [Aspergillus avenaceus]|uniref:Alpha/Beta hydrolase protein n=1 Tax=Aspergillus avenaceus TaxID=36643 RepID=A0A5N6TTI1_ASPAV|nr:Alpha/Beta hydrolase protein [Aspergillus avenaceus]